MKKSNKAFLITLAILVITITTIVILVNRYSNSSDIGDVKKNLSVAKTIEDCDKIAEKIDKTPNCSMSFGSYICVDSGSSYSSLMASCIAGIGIKENKQGICHDPEINRSICEKAQRIFPEVSELPSPNWDIDECAGYVAKKCDLEYLKKSNSDTDVSIDCESYEDSDERDDCFLELAIKNNDYNLCANIEIDAKTLKMKQEVCYHYLAVRNNDEKICEKFKLDSELWPGRNSVYAGNCNKLLSVFRNNGIAACDNISLSYYGSSNKSACLMFYAIFKHDISLCDKEDVYNDEICKKLAELPRK